MSSTSSTSSSTLNLTGLVSNTDWQSLVSSINSAQKQAVEGPLNSELTNEQNILSAWQSFNTSLSTITNYISTNNLNSSTGYQSYNASLTCSDSSITPSNVLSASIGTGTIAAGTYAIKVANLATPEQIASDNFSSSSTALGYSGDMLINGKDISVASTDTLGSIAAKINDANAGVSANVLTVSGNQYRLVLQSTSTGTSSMALRDGDASDVLESLNLLNDSTPAFLNASGANALSDSFSSESTPVGISPLLSLTSPQSGSIQIEGSDSNWYSVSVNLKTDSLQTIANNITNAAIPGVTASVVPTTTNGTTTYQLQITNTAGSSPPSMKDSNSILDTLGLYGGTVKNVLQAGQNANLSVDGYNVTSASNTVTGVINGVTLNLTGTNPTTAINLNITADNSGLSSQVSTLVSDISTALAFINSQNTVNSSSASATANVLMGNGNLFTMKNTIVNTLLENIPGNSTYTTAGSIGIDFGNDGSVSLNSDTFDAALSANPTEVQNAIQTLSTDLYKSLNVYVDPTTGTVQSIENSVNSQITNINTQLTAADNNCAQEAQQLDDEYTNLQLLLEQSSQTQNFLTQMFDTMTGTTSSSSSASSL
ncbi:MAG: flagellar filament capping protein FliD [Syntrophorhabdales bacterium]|jgi:flagellar hook-associated protein 2